MTNLEELLEEIKNRKLNIEHIGPQGAMKDEYFDFKFSDLNLFVIFFITSSSKIEFCYFCRNDPSVRGESHMGYDTEDILCSEDIPMDIKKAIAFNIDLFRYSE